MKIEKENKMTKDARLFDNKSNDEAKSEQQDCALNPMKQLNVNGFTPFSLTL